MAATLGILPQRLAHYETGFAALPWAVARTAALNAELRVHPRFLAIGKKPESLHPHWFSPLVAATEGAQPRARFTAVWDESLSQLFTSPLIRRMMITSALEEANEAIVNGLQNGALSRDEASIALEGVATAADCVMGNASSRARSTPLDTKPYMVLPPSVSPTHSRLADLLERALPLTATADAKRALCEYLEARPQHLQRWLKGKVEPGGEITLRLEEWVTKAEASQQKAAPPQRTERRKAQSRKDDNEKSTSDPPIK